MNQCLTHHHACACREAAFQQLKQTAKDLLYNIEISTDCMSDLIKRAALDEWMAQAEAAIKAIDAAYEQPQDESEETHL